MNKPTIHTTAAQGFSHAANAYERGRPDYPDEAVKLLVSFLGLGPGKLVVEPGAGTGKFTRLLVPSQSRIIAVEPVAEMRLKLSQLLPEVEALDGTAEAIPLPDGSVDAVVAAQAFHWFQGARRPLPSFTGCSGTGGDWVSFGTGGMKPWTGWRNWPKSLTGLKMGLPVTRAANGKRL
jgi:ubiquinone/menaquinone biosynthesis C-methylase UbiE